MPTANVYSRNRRFYSTLVSTYGTAVAPTNSNAMRAVEVKLNPTQTRMLRPDVQPSLDSPVPSLGRKSCPGTMRASLAGSGTRGTPPDIHPYLYSLFGKYTNVAATSDTYETDDVAKYLDVYTYVTDGGGESCLSSIVQQAVFEFGQDYSVVEFQFEGKSYLSSWSFAGTDTEGKCGHASYPTEPASPALNGAAVPGYKGSVTIDSTAYTNGRTGKITCGYAKPLPKDGWGTDYPLDAGLEIRKIDVEWTQYDTDLAALTTLKGKAHSGTQVDAVWVLGSTSGNIWTFTLNDIFLNPPTFDDSQSRRIVQFSGTCYATSGTAKDSFKLAIT